MKRLTTVVLCFATICTYAQSKLPNPRVSIKPDIEKVVYDYFDNFDNIKGDTILQSVSTIEFSSKIIPEGSTET
ncbi:MAG: hypothetical protein Q8891_00765 [Bacteroidota bacterium]|nr:hypothetical protein [Bacteroidota bacterium]